MNVKNFISITTLLLSIILWGCSKEDSSIVPSYEGVVVNSLTNQPFEGIMVSVTNGVNTKLSTTTNNLGEFKFSLDTEGLSGEYYIQIGNGNTEKKQIQITGVGKAKNDLGIIKLQPDSKPVCTLTELKLTNGIIKLTGEIVSAGYSDITSVGFIISPTQEMTGDCINLKGTVSGNSFSASIDEKSLKIDTSYFFFAYTQNSVGVGYSESRLLDAESITPVVRWRSNKSSFDYETNVLNLSTTTMTLKAFIASNGGSELAEYGFCWVQGGIPTMDGEHISVSGEIIGEYYTCLIEGLKNFTTYCVRPYAKNRLGVIGYGPIGYIETEYVSTAQASITSVLNVGATQIKCEGTVAYSNCTLEEVGFCYSTQADPKVSDSKVKAKNVERSYSCTLNNLNEGTTYYVRPYVITTEKEVFYGNVKAITTLVNVKITIIDPNNKPISDAHVSIVGGNVGNINTYQYRTDTSGMVNAILEVANYGIIITSSPYAQRIVNLDVKSLLQPITIQMSY